MNNKVLYDKNIVIVAHELTTGPAHELRDYFLQNKASELLFISHPLLYTKDGYKKKSYYELYRNGKIIEKAQGKHPLLPEFLLYIKDILYTLFWILKQHKGYNYFFGINNFNAFAGVMLAKIGLVEKAVYYVIDYVPIRFSNKLINNIYHLIEKYCAESSYCVWNLSPRMIIAREKKWKRKFENQLVVPHGVHFKRIKKITRIYKRNNQIIYMGTILEKQGIQLVIQTLPKLLKKVSDLSFNIIGDGPYREDLEELVKKLKLGNYVNFLGYIKSHIEVENRISESSIAVALYNKKFDTFSYYGDPGKIKNYLGAGVPVVLTDVPYIANEIKNKKCGFVITYSQNALYRVLSLFLKDKALQKAYQKNALEFSKKYDWDLIFDKAFIYGKGY